MKQRLITAAIGLALFIVIMFFYTTIIYNIAIAVVCILAVYELLSATKYVKNKFLTVISLIFAAVVPFLRLFSMRKYSILFLFMFTMLLFAILFFGHKTIRIEQIGLVFFVAVFFPVAISSLIYIRDQFGMYQGIYYTILVFACAWGADAGAYFIGRFFGKNKLVSEISPNKTIEGFWGGFIGCFLFMGLVTFCYVFIMNYFLGITVHINYIILVPVGLVGTLLSVFGDLSASIIKRQCSIKDFGNIMPGHGGVVDRFDSIFFVAPFFYVILQFFII